MQTTWLIIDGYSLLHRYEDHSPILDGDLASAREQLVRRLDRIAPTMAEKTTIVFDGSTKVSNSASPSPLLHVVFAPRDRTADTVIEQLVYAYDQPERICVVTSDRLERETVMAAGAHVISCVSFLEWCQQQDAQLDHKLKAESNKQRDQGNTLGDFFP